MSNNYDYKRLTPFKWFVLQNFPFIDEDFDAITNYQLFCKLGEEINKLIESQNQVGEQVELLTTAFNNLKDYVDNYFDNLDVQEEVNNKLDAMVEDGTLAEIINQEIFGELNEQVTTNKNDISDLKDRVTQTETDISSLDGRVTQTETDISSLENQKIADLRKEQYNYYHLFEKPADFINSFFNRITIYESNSKKNYKVDARIENYKRSGGNTYYVAKNGSNTDNDGLSREHPWQTLRYAIAHATDNSTIILTEGIYQRTYQAPHSEPITKNLNIIGEGRCVLSMSDELSYLQNAVYPNVYEASRTNVDDVIDIRAIRSNVESRMTRVNSIQDVSLNKNSWYTDGNTVYVNNGGTVDNSNTAVTLKTNNENIYVHPSTANISVYLEHIICIGGNVACLSIENNTTYIPTVYAKDCKFLYGGHALSENAVNIYGANAYFLDCDACYSKKDGFNYSSLNGITSQGIEINCTGSNNGRGTDDDSNNGSTAHNGAKVIRINGNYFNNKGSNVGDTQNSTESININCNSFDSIASTETLLNADFYAIEGSVVMYLYNCFAKGNSVTNVRAGSSATIYNSNSEYNTSSGNIVNI